MKKFNSFNFKKLAKELQSLVQGKNAKGITEITAQAVVGALSDKNESLAELMLTSEKKLSHSDARAIIRYVQGELNESKFDKLYKGIII